MADPYLEKARARVGQVARKWTLDRLIDVGGMAAVYAATHRNGNRVAIKVMHRNYAAMPEAKERFLREGYMANKVEHPNAVTVLDDDVLDDGTPFIVMELLDGGPLEARLARQGTLSVAQTLYVADQLLDVLASAHAHGIIHRDIKPANVFITRDGQVKVLDFGLARLLELGIGSVTRTGTVMGTSGYMSPEQARGKRDAVDHRTDIFAVGAVAFQSLTGRPVRIEPNPMDRLIAAASEPVPSLATLVPSLPPDVVAVFDRSLAFDRDERWPDASTMRAEVARCFAAHGGGPAQVVATSATPGAGGDDTHVSVLFEPGSVVESILVDLAEPESAGESVMVDLDDVGDG